MRRNNLTREDVCMGVGITQNTLKSYIDHPELMQLCKIVPLAGLFNVPVETLVYMFIRNKSFINKNDKWYLEDIKSKRIEDDI